MNRKDVAIERAPVEYLDLVQPIPLMGLGAFIGFWRQ
jgi:hypothetical protein